MTENQTNELFRLINMFITKIDGLGNKIDSFNAKFDDAEEKKKNYGKISVKAQKGYYSGNPKSKI